MGLLDLDEQPCSKKKKGPSGATRNGWAQCHHPDNGDQSRLEAALVWAMVAGSETGGRAAGVCSTSAITAAALLTQVYTS